MDSGTPPPRPPDLPGRYHCVQKKEKTKVLSLNNVAFTQRLVFFLGLTKPLQSYDQASPHRRYSDSSEKKDDRQDPITAVQAGGVEGVKTTENKIQWPRCFCVYSMNKAESLQKKSPHTIIAARRVSSCPLPFSSICVSLTIIFNQGTGIYLIPCSLRRMAGFWIRKRECMYRIHSPNLYSFKEPRIDSKESG